MQSYGIEEQLASPQRRVSYHSSKHTSASSDSSFDSERHTIHVSRQTSVLPGEGGLEEVKDLEKKQEKWDKEIPKVIMYRQV